MPRFIITRTIDGKKETHVCGTNLSLSEAKEFYPGIYGKCTVDLATEEKPKTLSKKKESKTAQKTVKKKTSKKARKTK